eukprot:COSAG05_NODE_7426_length_812_cov_5.017563_1_plen_41_part_10
MRADCVRATQLEDPITGKSVSGTLVLSLFRPPSPPLSLCVL